MSQRVVLTEYTSVPTISWYLLMPFLLSGLRENGFPTPAGVGAALDSCKVKLA